MTIGIEQLVNLDVGEVLEKARQLDILLAKVRIIEMHLENVLLLMNAIIDKNVDGLLEGLICEKTDSD